MRTPDRPVFVMGCARSGTTLLQLMIQSHPRLAMPPETRFLMATYARRTRFGDPSDPDVRDAVADFIIHGRRTRFRDLKLDADLVRRRIREAPPTIGSFIGAVFAEYAARFDRPRWGDKRPKYIEQVDQILALFPDVQLVHIIRDGRSCVASLKGMHWWKNGTMAAVDRWVNDMRTGDWAREHLRADQYHELHYEALVQDPESVLGSLCEFLGEEFHPAMLEPRVAAEAELPARQLSSYHRRTARPVDTATVRSWEDRLEPWELRLMEHVARPELEACGYPVSRRWVRRRPSREDLARYLEVAEQREQGRRGAAAADAKRSAAYPWPVAAELTTGQRRLAGERQDSLAS